MPIQKPVHIVIIHQFIENHSQNRRPKTLKPIFLSLTFSALLFRISHSYSCFVTFYHSPPSPYPVLLSAYQFCFFFRIFFLTQNIWNNFPNQIVKYWINRCNMAIGTIWGITLLFNDRARARFFYSTQKKTNITQHFFFRSGSYLCSRVRIYLSCFSFKYHFLVLGANFQLIGWLMAGKMYSTHTDNYK